MQKETKSVFIFEGPDGAGKTTAAKHFADTYNLRYIHCGPLSGVKNIARLYVEAMMPALLGYQSVVLDRSWHSEIPYATAFREGDSRLSKIDLAMLDRLAMRCGGALVCCLPDWDIVEMNFEASKHNQMLVSKSQLEVVYEYYARLGEITSLPIYRYNYVKKNKKLYCCIPDDDAKSILSLGYKVHYLDFDSAGNLDGKILMVGDEFGKIKNEDPLYQWPFASFSKIGCSQKFTGQLLKWSISESDLLWINADQDLPRFFSLIDLQQDRKIFCLGRIAQKRTQGALSEFSSHRFNVSFFDHPQYMLRFSNQHDIDSIMSRMLMLLNSRG